MDSVERRKRKKDETEIEGRVRDFTRAWLGGRVQISTQNMLSLNTSNFNQLCLQQDQTVDIL